MSEQPEKQATSDASGGAGGGVNGDTGGPAGGARGGRSRTARSALPRQSRGAREGAERSRDARGGGAPGLEGGDGPRMLNRDLSWLEFNRRVLAQAADARTPLLERVKFLAIFTSNLDEFFMKRVAILKRLARAGVKPGADGAPARQVLSSVRLVARELCQEQRRLWADEVRPALTREGIEVVGYADLSAREREWVDEWYRNHAFAALTPLAVDTVHRFPFISNLSENLAVLVRTPVKRGAAPPPVPTDGDGAVGVTGALHFARVKIPAGVRRCVPVRPPPGSGESAPGTERFVPLVDVVRHNLGTLFPGVEVVESVLFRVTRSSGVQTDDRPEFFAAPDLSRSVEEELRQRRFARAIRLEIEPDPPAEILRRLLDRLNLEHADVYEGAAPLDFTGLTELLEVHRPDLRERPYRPVVPRRLATLSRREPSALFAAIRRQDLLVHHPYESFQASVERFVEAAASDPDVVAIRQTLYRTSPDSPFVQSLIQAVESGKQVACLVELRARFDEGRNLRFARQLERAGVHVAYGVVGLKTHCKTSLVVRRESRGLRVYAHIGTGNYHPKTAQLYTDVGLFTADPDITADAVQLFNYLTGVCVPSGFTRLLVAPFTMRQRFMALIDREIEHARAGRPARIVAKMNALEDPQITERLYAASGAGVPVTLIVRGFCCLRPGVPGLSENIRVLSVVGRFLEHSRVFHFGAGSADPLDGDWYIGSADWMYRNLSNRVECATPVDDPDARRTLWRMLEVMTLDRRHCWEMRPDGGYEQRAPGEGDEPDSPAALGTFETLMHEATRDRR